VTIFGLTGSARTGRDGRFTWVPEPRPPFQVLVVLPGGLYTSPILVERLPSDGSLLVLDVRLATSERVTVDAGSTPHTEAPPANAASILLGGDLAQRRPANLTDAIAGVPGASAVGEGQSTVPSLRGLARGRTLLLIDGARVTSERRAGPSATFLDPAVLEAIEIARGPGSVAWGSDALGGVVHARTRDAPRGGPWTARLTGSAGAGLPARALAAEAARGLGDGGVLVQGRMRDFDDYASPRGRVPDSAFRDGGFRLRAHREIGPGRLGLGWQSDLVRDLGKPSSESDVARTVYPIEDSHRLTLAYDGDPRGGLQRWSVHAFAGTYRLVTERDRLATDASPREVSRSDVSAGDYAVRASGSGAVGTWRLQGGLDASGRVGLEALGSEERYDEEGALVESRGEVAIATASRHDLGAWGSLDGRLVGPLTLSAGLRLDRVATRNEGGHFGDRSTRHDAVSGALGVVAGPVLGMTVTGQVSRGFRDPTLSDRYYRGVSGRGFVTGNPDLEPETSRQYDVALRRPGRVRTALYLYRYEIRDLVERYREGADFLFRNRGRALLRGIELEAQAELGGGFWAEIAVQAAEGRAVDDRAPLADVPAEEITLTARKTWSERAAAWARVTLKDRRDDPGPAEQVVPGHGVVDLGGAWRPRAGLEASLVVGNLLDAEYLGSPDELAVPAPGRRVLLTLTGTF